MTHIRTGFFETMAALPQGENKLPQFRDPKHDLQVHADKEIPEQYTKLMGLDCGRRILPYTMLDRYDRKRTATKLPAIIMENERLKATFLPSLGGRLISLIDLSDGRELLFCNTSLQVANLAIRNAWFAGGIEWNIGQYGHSFSTCGDVFASIQTDTEGEPFLRLYDYERCKGLWWQIDFHLPADSRFLYAHATIHNLYEDRTTMYYWTNIAVRMTDDTRVFASSDDALYLDPYAPSPVRRYGHMKMPKIDLYPELDASYPARFPYSQEYFFTCDKSAAPWEAAIENDGKGFFDVSTHPLSYRKMFCWGSHIGGRHWQEFLAPGLGEEYVEIQSGLAPTQLHGMYLDGHQSLSWTQAFGAIEGDPEKLSAPDYAKAKTAASVCAQTCIDEANVEQMHRCFLRVAELPAGDLLHSGNGWGFLESRLRGHALPPAVHFPEDSITDRERPWDEFLKTGILPQSGEDSFSYPSVVGPAWTKALELAIDKQADTKKAALLKHYLGIALLEDEQAEDARRCWLEVYEELPNAWTARNLAVLELRLNAADKGLEWYGRAMRQAVGFPYLPMAEEFFKILIDQGERQEALEFFQSLPASYIDKSDYLALDRARLAAELGEPDVIEEMVINRELGNIREGDIQLNTLWDRYCQLKHGKRLPLPDRLNFTQFDPEPTH